MWRSEDGESPAWSDYTSVIEQKAIRHAEELRKAAENSDA